MAVVNGVVKVTIVLRAPVQDSLTTDCLCVLDVGIGTCNRHVKATVTLVPDNYNNDLRIFVFRFFEIGIIAPFALTRELIGPPYPAGYVQVIHATNIEIEHVSYLGIVYCRAWL
jgi:hypothetical protein